MQVLPDSVPEVADGDIVSLSVETEPATQREPSGAAAIEGMSSWRDSWPTEIVVPASDPAEGPGREALPGFTKRRRGSPRRSMVRRRCLNTILFQSPDVREGYQTRLGAPSRHAEEEGQQNEWYQILA